jgi:hypothetical protein
MKGYKFFEEYRDPGMQASSGNVIAVNLDGGTFVQDGGEYLGSRCRHVSEEVAREIHPKLFEYLEALA